MEDKRPPKCYFVFNDDVLKKNTMKNSKSIEIGGVYYSSLAKAAGKLNISYYTINNALKSGEWKGLKVRRVETIEE